MSDKNNGISIDNSTFFKFRRLYLLAFLFIAATIVIAQILIQKHLDLFLKYIDWNKLK